MSLYKKELDDFIAEYENGQLTDENEIKFMNNFYYKLPLDRSKSTMNRICWAIENEFDGIDMFKEVVFDYSILKSGIEYDANTFDLIKYICNTYKPSVLLAKKNVATQYDSDIEEDWQSVDIILQNLIQRLYEVCPNEEELCEILIDLCYGDNVSKQILWKACGDVLINRLLKTHEYKMSYPQKTDSGDFWCQGIQYTMKEIVVKGGDGNEAI